ncbi:MAG: hypothetical protein ABWJ90_01950 [Thermus sp.]|uniref:hypothetical protein n=1 Tax=Thermus TaxID=270 RepID=UPI001FA962DC|nr:hypothetical protein [Thermus thalpophilus]
MRKPPTPKQLRYIRWLGKRLGMTEGELLDYANRFLSEETGRRVKAEDFSDLAREEAAALIGHLLGLESYLENDRG